MLWMMDWMCFNVTLPYFFTDQFATSRAASILLVSGGVNCEASFRMSLAGNSWAVANGLQIINKKYNDITWVIQQIKPHRRNWIAWLVSRTHTIGAFPHFLTPVRDNKRVALETLFWISLPLRSNEAIASWNYSLISLGITVLKMQTTLYPPSYIFTH